MNMIDNNENNIPFDFNLCLTEISEQQVEIQRENDEQDKFYWRLSFGIEGWTAKGSRKYNLDRFFVYYNQQKKQLFISIFDGHGTNDVSQFLSFHLYQKLSNHPFYQQNLFLAVYQTFSQMDSYITSIFNNYQQNIGSTAILCIIRKSIIYTVNLGDSKAVVLTKSNIQIPLNNEHSTNCSRERVLLKQKGALFILKRNQYRLFGQLNISRSFGDSMYKKYMIKQPQITIHKISQQDDILIVGSDGYWNWIKNQNEICQDNATVIKYKLNE